MEEADTLSSLPALPSPTGIPVLSLFLLQPHLSLVPAWLTAGGIDSPGPKSSLGDFARQMASQEDSGPHLTPPPRVS